MRIVWHPDTQVEIDEIVDHYFEKRLGLESEFIDGL